MTRRDLDIGIPTLTRVEGEGALHVAVDAGEIVDLRLEIYEPPRFFEAFLRGRGFGEPVDITARVCGICPVAYQMSAATALEHIAGVQVDPIVQELRRLLYAGEWIESHALHVGFLHAPDFLGAPSGLVLAERHPEMIERILRLKKTGNDIVELVGGRPIHPVNVRLGGFHRAPDREAIAALAPLLDWAREAAVDLVEWVSGFEFPDVTVDHELVSLRGNGYPVFGERLVSDRGLDLPIRDFDTEFVEFQVPHSTAMHCRRRHGDGCYLTGPLARWANNRDRVPDAVDELARRLHVPDVERNPFRSIVIRGLEILIAVEQAIAIVDGYVEPTAAAVATTPVGGSGWGATEAPRGALLHRYEVSPEGSIVDARIIPPTSQNQAAIEADVRSVVEDELRRHGGTTGGVEWNIRHRCEVAIRNHDPCISCATHFLEVHVTATESSDGG